MAPYDNAEQWVHYLTRPFSLFGASIWHTWYSSKQTQQIVGKTMPSVLFIEEHPNVMRQYRTERELQEFKNALQELVLKRPDACFSLLQKGERINAEAEQCLAEDIAPFNTLTDSVDFLTTLALHATILPFFTGLYTKEVNLDTPLKNISETLRGISHYPAIYEKVVLPLARRELKEEGGQGDVELLTYQELLRGDISLVKERQLARQEKKCFVYQIVRGEEKVSTTDTVASVVMALEGVTNNINVPQELKGQTAFKGKARGIARIVLTPDGRGVDFHEGNILVSINSNPNLMNLIMKSAAIVTDEGGITSHAAIISREFKKPCVIGTKIATSLLKDGDEIEVDADNGVVRILNRA